ncbi:nitroreductase [Agrilactobacillus composti DSM 18527 = JCM 14202]|uniref:Nitroreductase n=1 Tax=Agrilactobacillus composti DSM 18527 = JCM 14202 TaxID=1423734 RepID=A0A0R1YBM5_9LACO|nr:nitroreductase family protein [Agrilactobacillus composti]KRM36499.1 nitroreductase [Agrilactobacillus composti DSM 18527 = JCM 14202]
MTSQYLDAVAKRRSIYALGKNLTQSNSDIVELAEKAIELAPSAFNNQTTRAVFLFNENHDKLWDLTLERLRPEVPSEEAFKNTQAKIEGFKAAYGTILYFTDVDIVKSFEENFTLYADNFADWAEQGQGNAQFNVWTAFANENIGANLQHYNPLIDADVKSAFNIPASWKLRAEMPFGSIEAGAGDKEYMNRSDRFKVLD